MNAITPLFLALLLSACAAIQKPEPEIKRAQPKPQEIQIQSAPPGALVDWNGNVFDVAPVTIELTPSFSQYASHYSWPSNGARTQRFRARWPDGAMNSEFFESDTGRRKPSPSSRQALATTPTSGPHPPRKNCKLKKDHELKPHAEPP